MLRVLPLMQQEFLGLLGSGTNLTTTDGTTSGNIGRLSAFSAGTAPGFTGTTASVKVAGEDFSFSESYIEGDKPHAGSTVASGVIGTLPVLGSTVTSSGGVAGTLAGTVGTDGALTITAGELAQLLRVSTFRAKHFQLMKRSITFQGENGIESFDCPEDGIHSRRRLKTPALPCLTPAGLVPAAPVQPRSLPVKSIKAISHFWTMIRSRLATCFCAWLTQRLTWL